MLIGAAWGQSKGHTGQKEGICPWHLASYMGSVREFWGAESTAWGQLLPHTPPTASATHAQKHLFNALPRTAPYIIALESFYQSLGGEARVATDSDSSDALRATIHKSHTSN